MYCRAKWVKVGDILYKEPCALLVGVEEDDPVFGRLKSIYVVNDRIIFELNIFQTHYFHSHYYSYIVSSTSSNKLFLSSQLLSPFPVHIHRLHAQNSTHLAIVPKYHICGTLL